MFRPNTPAHTVMWLLTRTVIPGAGGYVLSRLGPLYILAGMIVVLAYVVWDLWPMLYRHHCAVCGRRTDDLTLMPNDRTGKWLPRVMDIHWLCHEHLHRHAHLISKGFTYEPIPRKESHAARSTDADGPA